MNVPAVGAGDSGASWADDLIGSRGGDEGPPRPRVRRTWFEWSATSLPVAPLLILGTLLGPQGLVILTPPALAALDPALPVALAGLGALVGLMPAMQGHVLRALGSAALAGGLTVTAVALIFALGASVLDGAAGGYTWLLPLIAGIAAASSLIVPVRRRSTALSWTGVVIEAEAFMSVVAGALLLAFARQSALAPMVLWMAQACAVVSMLGLAGWLLARRSLTQSEQRIFAVATLLLVGGAADYLSFSALAGGLCAGLLWTVLGGPSRDSLERDLLYALHPFTALVLVVAGARVELTTLTLGLGAGYACLRVLARYGASTLGARMNPGGQSSPSLPLIEPGVFGVAFVVTAFRALGSEVSIALSIVVIGTVLCEIAAMFVTAREDAA